VLLPGGVGVRTIDRVGGSERTTGRAGPEGFGRWDEAGAAPGRRVEDKFENVDTRSATVGS